MSEESKLVDEVVETPSTETTESKEVFNPLAFAGDEVYNPNDDKTEAVEEKQDEVEETKTEDTEQDDDGFSWDKVEVDGQEDTQEEEYDWDGTAGQKQEEKPAETELDWNKFGKELGIETASKEDFVNAINALQKNAQQEQNPQAQKNATVSDQVAELKSYLNYSDRDLVAEELKADGIEDSEIEESLDKLEDSGMMKMKAKSIRRVINNAIDQQTTYAQQQAQQNEEQRKQAAEQAKKQLKEQIKNMNEFMGGKVTKKQKEEVYRYATGDLMKDIYANHANVADVAMFMLYRKQIEKILRSQGLEDGKAAIMDSIVSPNLNTGKGKSNFKVKSSKFDPKAFMSE
tara:strand:- start:244 stop:1278 length:1035 start_codon:yes stop_codon:yes gene_type:complete